MAPKSSPRTWYDVQMAIAAIAMSLTMVLWNLFAGPDRAEAARKAVQQAQATPPPTEIPLTALSPTPMPIVKIIFANGTVAQSSSVSPQPGKPNKKRDNGAGGGGGGATSTKSS